MGAAGMEFSGISTAGNLSLTAEHKVSGKRKKGSQRQSGLFVFLTVMRRLPLCSLLSSAAVWVAGRFLPFPLRWTVGAWSAGLLAAAMAVSSAVISWTLFRWDTTDDRLIVRYGFLFRRDISLRRSSILSSEVRRTPLSAIFDAVYLTIHTSDRTDRRPLRLILNRQQAAMLSARLIPSGKGRSHGYRAGASALWLAALSGEGLAAFFSAASALLSILRDVAGIYPKEQLERLIHFQGLIPALAGTIAGVWLLKVIHTRLSLAGMTFIRTGRLLTLERGKGTSRSERVKIRDVSGFDLRLSLPGSLTGRWSGSLLLRGGQRYPLLPPVDARRLRIETAAISPHGTAACAVLPLCSPIVYAGGRWAACLAVLPLASILRRISPFSSTAIHTLCVTAAGLLLWRALATTFCAPKAGLRIFSDCMEITGVRRLTIHTLRVLRPSVGMIRITQWPLSRTAGVCTVKVIPRGKGMSLRCIKLPFERAKAACEKMM